jgi:hypothetical protein
VRGGTAPPFTYCMVIQMRATRDFYNERASALAALAEQSKCQDQQSDLLDLARAWRDLADVWEAPDTESSSPSRSRRAMSKIS